MSNVLQVPFPVQVTLVEEAHVVRQVTNVPEMVVISVVLPVSKSTLNLQQDYYYDRYLTFLEDFANGVVAIDCTKAVLSSPTCADSSWVLYSKNDSGVLHPELGVCCPAGWDVDQQLECAPIGATGASSSWALFVAVSPSTPGGHLSFIGVAKYSSKANYQHRLAKQAPAQKHHRLPLLVLVCPLVT
jgi:hypothetical protein